MLQRGKLGSYAQFCVENVVGGEAINAQTRNRDGEASGIEINKSRCGGVVMAQSREFRNLANPRSRFFRQI